MRPSGMYKNISCKYRFKKYKNKMYKKQTKFNFERKKHRARNRSNEQNEKKNLRQKQRAKNRDREGTSIQK
jgi:hypothetical protein